MSEREQKSAAASTSGGKTETRGVEAASAVY